MLSRFFAIRPGEVYRVGVIASLLFLLIAANNLIKILRDSLFLSGHSVSELPYLYILVAVIAGSLMLLLGGNVLGGQVHGLWPGLEQDQLFGPGDLAVTTDYRDVLPEVCRFRLNNPAISEIFLDYQPQRSGFVRKG